MSWKLIDQPSPAELSNLKAAFAKDARFLADQNMPANFIAAIRSLGWNIKTVDDLRVKNHSDEDVLAAAKREGRILLTLDTDFLNEQRFPPNRNPGIVILAGGSGDEDALTRSIAAMLPLVGTYSELFKGATVKVTNDGSITVRDHDYDTGARTKRRYRYSKKGAEIWVD